MSGALTKERLEYLCDRLNDKLETAEQTGEIYIVGGATMVLAHQSERATEDVDSHIRKGRPAINKTVLENSRRGGPEPVLAERSSDNAAPSAIRGPQRAGRIFQHAPAHLRNIARTDDRNEAALRQGGGSRGGGSTGGGRADCTADHGIAFPEHHPRRRRKSAPAAGAA